MEMHLLRPFLWPASLTSAHLGLGGHEVPPRSLSTLDLDLLQVLLPLSLPRRPRRPDAVHEENLLVALKLLSDHCAPKFVAVVFMLLRASSI